MTLLLVAYQMVGGGMPVLGYLCIVLNFVLLPLTFYFNMRRLKRRKDVLAAFVVEHKIPSEPRPGETKKDPVKLMRVGSMEALVHGAVRFFEPTHLTEAWDAGNKSEHQIFSAVLAWIDTALKRPVSLHRWCQILWTLEQLPLLDTAHSDVRHGASQTRQWVMMN
jgi:hypothetical protein